MVDSISGNAASRAGLLAPQLSGGREPVEPNGLRLEVAGADRPSGNKPAGGTAANMPAANMPAANMPALVSEGRDAVRRMAAEPPVDSARVSDLREAIASGRYRVDPERIADAMLRSEPGLLRR